MADKKISALTAATTPLAGTEVLPIVQSGSTVKVSVADLTAGRAVSASAVSTTGLITAAVSSSNNQVRLERTVDGFAGFGYIYANSNNMFGVQDGSRYPFSVAQGAGTGSLVVDSSSNVNFGNGNLVQGTAAKGVNFTANTGAAGKTSQLLNWYEEGTWTPGQGSGLTVVGTFSSYGRYTRIGRLVYITGAVAGTTSVAVASSGQLCTGLPFTVSAYNSVGSATTNNVDVTAGILASNGSANVLATSAIAAAANIYFSVVYEV